jgi:hypothetical protein
MHFQTKFCNRNETYEETLLLQKLLLGTQIWQKPENQKHIMTNGQKIAPTKQASQLMNANRGKIPFQEHKTTALTCSILKFKSIRHQK